MEALRGEGYGAVGAGNGREALDVLNSSDSSPCLVVLDMMMPVMDGQMFLNRLHETRRADALPVLVVSAGVSEKRPGRHRVRQEAGRPQRAGQPGPTLLRATMK
jgi:CheY-like chemotaxis protein